MIHELALLRRKHALTQTELADLIGVSQTLVGRLEAGEAPTLANLRLKVTFALQVVFGKKSGQLFEELFREVEDAVMRQAAVLDRALDGQVGRATEHKRALLADMVRRAGNGTISA